MPDPSPSAPTPSEELEYLRTARAIRERAEALYALGLQGELEHFAIDEARLDYVVDRVLEGTRQIYPNLERIPYHGRFRHFGADRLARLDRALTGVSREEQLMTRFELVITSVLLDAGAGERWTYRDAQGAHGRSEGLALASFDWFLEGGLALDSAAPLRADAKRLAEIDEAALAQAFQVTSENPLIGLAGRAALLGRLGRSVLEKKDFFGSPPRLGALALTLARDAFMTGGTLEAPRILDAVLRALSDIWPSRETLAGQNLGDVFTHSRVGWVPFHKLSQWLTYSLCEPLELAGLTITNLDELTGLAEYRNGGLFVDAEVLRPKHRDVLETSHPVHSEVVVEWRALTVALLDRTAARFRERVGLTREELPLARVLEGGTWRTGRALAAEKRRGGTPPIRVISDGTVF